MENMRILFAEDDPELGPIVAKGLREQTYAVDLAAEGKTAAFLAGINEYDVILLDIMLPARSGLDVCRDLRARGDRTPVLMLTARDAVADRVNGLDAGADDYLTKPFAFTELLARIRALLRRGPQTMPDVIAVEDLVVDTRAQTATRSGRALGLTAKEYALLEYLVRNAGRLVSRADLSAHVWDDNHDPLSNSIEVYVSRLRKKLDGGGVAPLLHTRRGSGYMLAPDPERVPSSVRERP